MNRSRRASYIAEYLFANYESGVTVVTEPSDFSTSSDALSRASLRRVRLYPQMTYTDK